MRHTGKAVVAVFVLALSAAGCSGNGGPSTGETVGGAGGAILGGLAGSTIGSGSGRLIATGTGAVIGALVGSQVGKHLSERDEQRMTATTSEALENNETGEASNWDNPDSGNSGTVTPTETYQRDDGRYCREFQQTVYIDGEPEQAYGTACRQSDGSWEIVSS